MKPGSIENYSYNYRYTRRGYKPGYLHREMFIHLVNMNGGGQQDFRDDKITKPIQKKVKNRINKAIFNDSKENKIGKMNKIIDKLCQKI